MIWMWPSTRIWPFPSMWEECVCPTCVYHQRQIRTLRCSLATHSFTTLIHVFIICSKIDGNVVYTDLTFSRINQLQSVLNAAAPHLIAGIRRFGHLSSITWEVLRWLPMHKRFAFKILMLMRKCLAGCDSSYLSCVFRYNRSLAVDFFALLHRVTWLFPWPEFPWCGLEASLWLGELFGMRWSHVQYHGNGVHY